MLNVALIPYYIRHWMHVEGHAFFVKLGAVSTIKSETFGMFVNSSFI